MNNSINKIAQDEGLDPNSVEARKKLAEKILKIDDLSKIDLIPDSTENEKGTQVPYGNHLEDKYIGHMATYDAYTLA